MTELIKQRLVGMLIIVIASVVFLPDLLDGQKNSVKEDFKKLPPRPESVETPIVREFPEAKVKAELAKVPVVNVEEITDEPTENSVAEKDIQTASKEPNNQQKSVEASTKAEQPQQLSTNNNGQSLQFSESAWVLRLGTFRNKPNVDALLNKLENAGVTTFVKPVEAKAGTLYRVFVGPELEKSKLEKAQQTLKELTGLDGKITQFQPIN